MDFLALKIDQVIELNALQAWTIRASTDPVRMSLAWAQLIHIILVTFFAGNSLIEPFLNFSYHLRYPS